MFPPGASIRVAHSSNRHILALENEVELFDEVLKPLQTPTTNSKSLASVTTCDNLDFKDDSSIKDVTLLNFCE